MWCSTVCISCSGELFLDLSNIVEETNDFDAKCEFDLNDNLCSNEAKIDTDIDTESELAP